MVRTLVLAIGLSVSVSSAQGAFVGFAAIEGDSAAASVFAGAGAITFGIYATFDGAGDGTVNTVLSTGFANFSTTGGGTFYNSAFGTDGPPPAAFIPTFPELQYDTYGTIGATDNSGAGASIAMDPNASITSTHISGGWFNSNPPSHIGAAVANASIASGFGTLLWNITISTPDAGASVANITSLIRSPFGGAPTFCAFTQAPGGANQHCVVPSPGALGFFGIAGLAGLRRRR